MLRKEPVSFAKVVEDLKIPKEEQCCRWCQSVVQLYNILNFDFFIDNGKVSCWICSRYDLKDDK